MDTARSRSLDDGAVNAERDVLDDTPDAGDASDPSQGASRPYRLEWRCFHCDDVFTNESCARTHFGRDEDSVPACQIKAGAEGSLLKALRRAEEDAAEAWGILHSESDDFSKAYHRQAARHAEQLRIIEELGYERGLADAKADGWIPSECVSTSGPPSHSTPHKESGI
jgi:hypothetical protein